MAILNKKILQNYIYNLSYQILTFIIPLITAPYIARVLHAKGVGINSYSNTIVSAFILFAALGVNMYGQREVAYLQDEKYLRSKLFFELFYFRVIITLVVSIIYIVFCFMYKEYTVYLLIQFILLFSTMLDISWYFQGIEDFKTIAIRNYIIKILTVIFIFSFVKTENDLLLYIFLNAFSTFISNIFMFFRLKGKIEYIPFQELKIFRHTKGNIEFFIPIIAVQMYSQLDKIMLGAFVDNISETGFYEQMRQIINLVVMILTSLNTVLCSRNSHLFINNQKETIKKNFKISLQIILMISFPMMIGLFLISDNFIMWFLGEEYTRVSLLIKIACPLILLQGIGNFIGVQYLTPTKNQNKMTAAYLLSAVINVIFNLIFIPKMYAVGAIYATLIAEFVSCILQVYFLKKSDYNFKMSNGLSKYFFATVMMGISVVFITRISNLTGIYLSLLQIGLGIIVYFCLLFILKDENLMNFPKFLKKSNNKNEN